MKMKKRRVTAISYADKGYKSSLNLNALSMKYIGKVDEVIKYGPQDIDSGFYQINKHILNEKKGAGFYLWKPYVIKKSITKLNDGDYLIYVDAAIVCLKNITHLIKYMDQNDKEILCFETPFLEKNWTKQSVLEMHKNINEFQIEAAYMIFKVGEVSRRLVSEWLRYACTKDFIDDSQVFSPCIEHRYDQSLFSLVCRNNNIQPICSISDRYFYNTIVNNYDCFYIDGSAEMYAKKYYEKHRKDFLGWFFFCHHFGGKGLKFYGRIIKKYLWAKKEYSLTPKEYKNIMR